MLLQYESTVNCSNLNEILDRNSRPIHTAHTTIRTELNNILDSSLFAWSAIKFGTQHNLATEWTRIKKDKEN